MRKPEKTFRHKTLSIPLFTILISEASVKKVKYFTKLMFLINKFYISTHKKIFSKFMYIFVTRVSYLCDIKKARCNCLTWLNFAEANTNL